MSDTYKVWLVKTYGNMARREPLTPLATDIRELAVQALHGAKNER